MGHGGGDQRGSWVLIEWFVGHGGGDWCGSWVLIE